MHVYLLRCSRFMQEIAVIGVSGAQDIPFYTHQISTFFT
jgi:hypothetical protein